MRVKICGITNYIDAINAVNFEADAIGFVFYDKSPRYITQESAKKIIEKLPPFVEKVGLFVNESPNNINSICKTLKLTLAQIHFDMSDSEFFKLEVPAIRVIRALCKEDILKYHEEYRIVDSFVESYGGEGKSLELSWFKDIDCSKIILAGGLCKDTIKQLKPYGFYGVDVSSGVEKEKGIKDINKIKEFIKNAKS